MQIEIFIIVNAVIFSLLFSWAFKNLPGEKWQFICSIPYRKKQEGGWMAWNLTFYGFFTSVALCGALLFFLIMMFSLGIPVLINFLIISLILIICLPASRITAAVLEKKKYTSSVGGTFFVGMIIVPWVVLATKIISSKYYGVDFSVLSVMAAVMISYSIGEGLGRLACISYGCCYGKNLAHCSPVVKSIFKNMNFTFSGKMKKISYAHQWDEQQVIPIQALTAIIYVFIGLCGMYLFFQGFLILPLLINLIVTQMWRVLSEFLRGDYRGKGKISGYQIMALLSIIYGVIIIYLFNNKEKNTLPDLMAGLKNIWDPFIIIFVIIVGISIFIYAGKSKVTEATIDFKVIEKNI